jgi:hypothetical protein
VRDFELVSSRSALCLAVVVLMAVACGSSTPADTDSDFWVARVLPKRFVPVLLEETRDGSVIYYASSDDSNDEFDAPLRIRASPRDNTSGNLRNVEEVEVHGRNGLVVPLTDEGEVYGVALTWEQKPGLWLTVEGSQPITRGQVVAVADGLIPVAAKEWNRLRRALSIDTRVGRVDPGAVPIDALSGRIGSDVYRLAVLVPGDFPLGPEDRRLNCYRLTFRGDSSGDRCDRHPWWLRVGGQVFVFGPAAPSTRHVRIGPYEGSKVTPVVVATTSIDRGPPGRFYVHPLPEGVCFVELSAVDAKRDGNLGPIGPLPSNPEHASCLAKSGLSPGPPVTMPPK